MTENNSEDAIEQTNRMYGYREHIVQAEQKSVEAYDKGLLSLSGGALGLSIVFIKDIVPPGNIDFLCFLVIAWICWIGTIALTITSHYLSSLALRETIRQIDEERVSDERAGGLFSVITSFMNAMSGLSFILGLMFIVLFITVSIGASNG